MRLTLRELYISDDVLAWESVGFSIANDRCHIGTTTVRFVDGGKANGLIGWSFLDVAAGNIDGVVVHAVTEEYTEPGVHRNGSTIIDHIVMATPDLGRTNEALESAGIERRRVRDVPGSDHPRRQAFYRLGEVILEVVGPADPEGDSPARLWGLVTVVPDEEAPAGTSGPLLGAFRDAVQPGRRIATVKRDAGLSVPLAFLTPDPRSTWEPREQGGA